MKKSLPKTVKRHFKEDIHEAKESIMEDKMLMKKLGKKAIKKKKSK